MDGKHRALVQVVVGATLLALVGAAAVSAAGQERLSGTVTRVADGDTLDVSVNGRVYTVRLEGVDAPEAGQPFSREARVQLRVLALSRTASVHVSDHDRYGRLVARVFVWGTDLSEEMVRSGLAWHYTRYSPDARLAALEQQARQLRRGLWSDPRPVAPWDYRSGHPRASSAAPVPQAPTPATPRARSSPRALPGAYHGNTSSHVYHAPGCKDYECPHCTESFVSRAAAEAAGYRPHQACVGK